MATSLSNVYVEAFEQNCRILAQQMDSRLRGWVDEVSCDAAAYNWPIVGSQEASQKTTRLQDTPDQDPGFAERQSIAVTFDTGNSTEQEDIVQMLIDPNSKYVRLQGAAIRRSHDDRIIAAATGASRDGDGSPVAFDDTNQALGDGTAAIDFDIVTATTEIFMNNDIDPETPKCFVITPAQARKLLQLTEATSGDYNAAMVLTTRGYIESWMGYTWIVSTRLPEGAEEDSKYCFAMTRDAIGLQMNMDVNTDVGKDPGSSFAWRIYSKSVCGAVRVEDEQLVRLDLSETI
jgi:hypothetical protein